jgi:MFS family permease
MLADVFGMVLLTSSYLMIAFIPSLLTFYIFFIIAGMSFAIASPAKLSMFSLNMGRSQASKTWGIYHAVTFTGMGIATALGGVIAESFGFKTLFIIASVVNVIGIVPYWIYNEKHKDHKHFSAEI